MRPEEPRRKPSTPLKTLKQVLRSPTSVNPLLHFPFVRIAFATVPPPSITTAKHFRMLLKIASGNHLHSQYISTETGLPVYTILTRSIFSKTPSSPLLDCSGLRRPSVASSSSVSSGTSIQELNDRSWCYPLDSFVDGTQILSEEHNIKHTWILDAEEEVVAEIIFTGTSPTAIKLAGHKPVYGRFCTTGLFPSMEDRREEFRAGTRVDDLEWTVTKSRLDLVTLDDEPAITYHTNCRIDSSGKVRSNFLKGNDFVEFFSPLDELCKEDMAELMATFCLMELFRRGRFKLTPYVFDATSVFQRYHAIIRDNYIGAASWKLRQVLGRARSATL